MKARDMAFAHVKRKAEGMGYRWDGAEFRHEKLELRVAPVSAQAGMFGMPSATSWRKTFDKLVSQFNSAKATQEQAA